LKTNTAQLTSRGKCTSIAGTASYNARAHPVAVEVEVEMALSVNSRDKRVLKRKFQLESVKNMQANIFGQAVQSMLALEKPQNGPEEQVWVSTIQLAKQILIHLKGLESRSLDKELLDKTESGVCCSCRRACDASSINVQQWMNIPRYRQTSLKRNWR